VELPRVWHILVVFLNSGFHPIGIFPFGTWEVFFPPFTGQGAFGLFWDGTTFLGFFFSTLPPFFGENHPFFFFFPTLSSWVPNLGVFYFSFTPFFCLGFPGCPRRLCGADFWVVFLPFFPVRSSLIWAARWARGSLFGGTFGHLFFFCNPPFGFCGPFYLTFQGWTGVFQFFPPFKGGGVTGPLHTGFFPGPI